MISPGAGLPGGGRGPAGDGNPLPGDSTATGSLAAGGPRGRGSGYVRWYEVVGALVFLGLLSLFMLRWGLEGAVHHRKVVVVPDMKGMSLLAALDAAGPLNLALRKEGSEFNSSVPVGAVLRQNPPAGTKVREGKVVRVVLSQGGEAIFVPNLSGLPLRNAEMMLRANQLLLGEMRESYSLRLAKGMVLSQEPKPETSVEKGALVAVVISGGEPPSGITLMPDFQRKDISEAQAWADARGLRLTVRKDPAAQVAYGAVLSQEPAPDAVVPAGTTVRIVVSGKVRSPAAGGSQKTFQYQVPQGGSDNHVKVVLMDPYGERELFNGPRSPGSKVDLDIPSHQEGATRLKIFLNGILVEEHPL